MADASILTRCSVCGSPNVQIAMWVSPNTGEVHDDFGSWNAGDNTFCEDCDANTDLISYHEPGFKRAATIYERAQRKKLAPVTGQG